MCDFVSIDTVGNFSCCISPCTECQQKKVSLNTFLDTVMSDPPPQCLVWLPLMHRLANVENGKTPHRLFIDKKASRLRGCKVQLCIMISSHHTHNQPTRYTHAYLQWRWPIGTLHPVYECVYVCAYLWCTHHHKLPPCEQKRHCHMLKHICAHLVQITAMLLLK